MAAGCICEYFDGGWRRDLPDHRDFTLQHPVATKFLRRLRPSKGKKTRPSQVDWREYCGPVENQEKLATSAAHACIGLLQYFERRSSGRLIRPSRMFLHWNAQSLSGSAFNQAGAGLRTTFKAAIRFGLPPERFWPYQSSAIDAAPDPIAYGFDKDFQRLRYVRIDSPAESGAQTLDSVRSFLVAGFACSMGFGVPSSISDEPEIPFPTLFDSILTGRAVTAVGYDDTLRIRSGKGALLVRNSWGESWGMGGYGWLPYRYVTDKLCADIWTVLSAKWLKSDEFQLPVLN
jgi:C1A family cysteine protease